MVAVMAGLSHAREYGLNELITEALRTSREVKTVEAEIRKTDAQIREAYGSALPNITASANYQYSWETFSPISVDFGGMGGGVDTATINSLYGILNNPTSSDEDSILAANLLGMMMGMGALSDIDMSTPPNAIVLGISVQQPIYAQGKVGIGLKVAKAFKEGLLCKFDAARQKVKTEVTKLFYAALLSQDNEAIRAEGVTVASEIHRLAIARHAIGKAGEIDTFATRFALEQARIDLRSSQSQLRVALEALSKQAGIAQSADSFSVAGEYPREEYEIALSDAIGRMLQGNKSIGQLESGETVQKLLVKLSKTDFLPMVYCGAKLNKYLMFEGVDDIEWDTPSSSDRAVFVGASYTLFNGLQRRQKVKQAKENLLSYELTREQAVDGLEIALRSAWEAMQTNREQLTNVRAMVSLARKGYELTKKAYELGTSTLVDLQQAELKLKGAQMAENAALFAFHSAVLDLKMLMGDISMNNSSLSAQ